MTDVYTLTVTELDSTVDVDSDATAIEVLPPPDVYSLLVDEGCVSLSLVVSDESSINVVEDITDLTFEEITTTIQLVGEIGPPGRDGRSDQVTFKRNAGMVLSGHRIVRPQDDLTVIYADSTVLTDATKPLWLTLGAASTPGDEVTLVAIGNVTELSWSWIPGEPIFLGPNGTLTQTPPTSEAGDVFMAVLASPDTATDLYFNPRVANTL